MSKHTTHESAQEIPYGYCQCGCGQRTRIARQDNPKHGHIKGQPLRYVLNHSKTPPTIDAKFYQHAAPGNPNDCWEWQGSLNSRGYGRFTYRGKEHFAHRVSWEIHTGTNLSPSDIICHKCDNPRCINPHHLFVGTHGENTIDRVQKGRQAKGETCGRSKLTADDIPQIRALYTSGELQSAIAAKFGVSQTLVSMIIRGVSWKHV